MTDKGYNADDNCNNDGEVDKDDEVQAIANRNNSYSVVYCDHDNGSDVLDVNEGDDKDGDEEDEDDNICFVVRDIYDNYGN